MNKIVMDSVKRQQRPNDAAPVIDFKQLFELALKKWYWVLTSVLVCVLIACAYLWFTPATVGVTGRMEIVDKSKNGSSSIYAGLAMLNSLPLGLGSSLGGAAGSLGADAEKEIIMSTLLVKNVVNDLKLHTEYRICKWGRKTLLYQNNPISVSLDPAHLQWMDSELPLTYHQILLDISKSESGYEVETILQEDKIKKKQPLQTFSSLPATIKTEAGTITITENKLTAKQAKAFQKGYSLEVTIIPPISAAESFIARSKVAPPSKKVMTMLDITVQDENIIRGMDYVTHLVDAYNCRANDDKNEEARKTDDFVNARLAKLDLELGSSDAAWENSKKNFQITEPEIDAQEVMTKKSMYESKLVEIGTELQLHDYLSEYVHNPDNLYELIPVGLSGGIGNLSGDVSSGSETPTSNASIIAQHNTLVSQRNQLLRSMSEKAPQIQRVSEAIKDLHPALLTAMKRDRQNIILKRNAIEREYSKYMGKVSSAPKMERVLTEIGRQREIKQGVYLLMLQKREETAMDLANTTDKGRLIDIVKVEPRSAKPQKKIILLAALFLGVIIPIAALYLLQMLKQRIDTMKELEALTDFLILAKISNSNTEESIRHLRTNLVLNLKDDQKIILVASQNDGDGKTFIANLLKESFDAIGKKVLFVNGDLRNEGTLVEKVHPADILASEDFAQKIACGKDDNDYVIIDSPAIKKYSDALLLTQYADAILYIVKSGSSLKTEIESLKNKKNLPQLLLALNDISTK
jgi:capsular polysaccharide biosynthesis protein